MSANNIIITILIISLFILVIYYIINIYKSKMINMIKSIINKVKPILSKVKPILSKVKPILSTINNKYKDILQNKYINLIIKNIKNMLQNKYTNVIYSLIVSCLQLLINYIKNFKLVRIIINKIGLLKGNIIKENIINGNTISNKNYVLNIKDVKLLIKLVLDKTINKKVYNKLIKNNSSNNSRRKIDHYNIYETKIDDNIKKDLLYLESIIIKRINIANPNTFIVLLLYYINNSKYFVNKNISN